jgi:uncharacterized radical SAM superfamily Fe-S cluster-containing enzyme
MNASQMVEQVIGVTESVCPVCLKRVPAQRIRLGDQVCLRKTCERHGTFQTILWRGQPDFDSWYQVKKPERPQASITGTERGCPFDCGLCQGHRQQSCCVLLEVTQRCNLSCPLCFADAGMAPGEDPSRAEIAAWYQLLWDTARACNIQLSGGEPTVRQDLPEIIALGRSLGFSFIQLNTNGLRLAEDPDYARALKEAGLATVFLQFDGTREEIYQKIRGKSLLRDKMRAIENCARNRLGVVLVPTLVPGINCDNIGEIIRYALEELPAVRGIHFQPVSYFGRYPGAPADSLRITLPEVMTAIETQTGGLIKTEHLVPSGCEHSLCSFHGAFYLATDGRLTPLSQQQENSCCCKERGAEEAVIKARNFVARRWALPGGAEDGYRHDRERLGGWDSFLDRVQQYGFSITGMAFQDAWNLDLERLRDCCVHVVRQGKIIPFCAYNLTDRDGHPLYRRMDV